MIAVRLGPSEGPEAKQQPCLEVSRADGTRVWRRAWPADYPYKFTPYKPGFAIMSFSVGRFTGNNPLDVVVSFTGEKAGGASMAVSWPRLLGRPALNRAASPEIPPLASLDA